MDITALSVSIEVDMSAFVEAMDEVAAVLKTIADEFMAAETNAKQSFQGIFNAADNFKIHMYDTAVDIGAFIKDVTDASAGNFMRFAQAALDALKFFADSKAAYDSYKESTEQGSDSGASPVFTPNGDGHYTSNNSSSSAPLDGAGNNSGNQPNINDAFAQDFQQNLDLMHKLAPPDKAKIDIKVGVVGINDMQQAITVEQNMTNVINQEGNAHKKAGDAAKSHADILKDLGAMAMQTGAELMEGLGEALGKLATKQKNPFASLMKVLQDAVKQLGGYLIKIGIPLLLVPATAAEGALYEVGGVALEAVAAAMGSIKMAEGGIVHGSTLANIGEYAGASHNPEVVAPLDKLRGMVGGGGGTLTTRVQGSDLLFVLNNEMKNQGYSSGGNGLQQYNS
jgi:hypothetical protein